MRKLFLFIAMLMSIGAMAQDHTALIVSLKDGQQHVYALSDNPRFTFDGSKVNLTSDAISVTYDAGDLLNYTTEYQKIVTGVDDVDNIDFLFRNVGPDQYEVSGSSVKEVRIFTVNGMLLAMITAEDGNPIEVDFRDKQPGIYLVNINLGSRYETVKILKK